MATSMTKKEQEKAQKIMDVWNIEQEIFAYQMQEGTYSTKGMSKITRMSMAKKKALLDDLRRKLSDPPKFTQVVL